MISGFLILFFTSSKDCPEDTIKYCEEVATNYTAAHPNDPLKYNNCENHDDHLKLCNYDRSISPTTGTKFLGE